jgi:hypothetical protein
MVRQKIKGTKVRRSLSPEEEPNFYMPHWGKTKTVDKDGAYQLPAPVKSSPAVHTPKSKGRTQSSPRKAGKNLKKGSPAVLSNSLVSMIRAPAEQNAATLLPPPPVIKQLQPSGHSSEIPMSQAELDARGGDLLFFEGRPFRYLEHIEQIPPVPQQQQSRQSYKAKLHNMINSIVLESPSWQDVGKQQQNMCSV